MFRIGVTSERQKRNFPGEEIINKQLKTRSVPLNTKLVTQECVIIFKNTKSSGQYWEYQKLNLRLCLKTLSRTDF